MHDAQADSGRQHSLELGQGVARVPAAEWNALVGADSPFLEWEWLASLEQAGCVGDEQGWQPRPLLLYEAGKLVAACPLYVKAHSEGEFVFDWGWADAAARAGIAYYPKLLVGVPFTPVTGARFLCAPGQDRAACTARLAAALRALCADHALSGVHINFCLEEEASALERQGYLLRVGLQYHWRNEGFRSFDEYLAGLRSKRRNQVRRERRGVLEQGVRTEVLQGDAIPDALFEPLFRCYTATVDAHVYGRRYLNRRFFELIAERFRHRLCCVVARRGDEVVGSTLNVVKGEAFYGRYWGGLDAIRYLHFDVCYYAAIEHCIEAGIQRFEPGAGGDYKFLRGFDATATRSLHHLEDPRLARAIARFLEAERAEAGQVIEHLGRHSARKSSGP